ncbi:glycerophosphodiester phosphodiesterase family protein [Phaeodactylibacter xiamenensis]|uniref:glycerophosphodiester phosphodiesterase family protein n=1 Tax=Phaeodactylibacter xiamenensis TaxID=1524460 RepID=UPI0024A8E87B|nr:glycerophosphodiester phosphodiesterase family protein [Phaeodactylibacter xiamenensis]
MRQFYFLLLLLGLSACSAPSTQQDMNAEQAADFDWQGHRGARGLLPENTVPAFLKALEFPQVKTLELDLAVSQDSLLVVSHEPWMSHHICSHPDGRPVTEAEEEELLLFQMPYAQIKTYDCGTRGNERFPEQTPMPVHKPLLSEVVQAVNAYCAEHNRPKPRYNIEIKHDLAYDNVKAPRPLTFARLVLQEIEDLGIKNQTCVQSFDVRPLQELHRLDPAVTTALLVENPNGVQVNLDALGYIPDIYSPYYKMVTGNVVETVHDLGMAIIPWTVNDTTAMKALIGLGVDGIITDYPNKISAVTQN